MDELLDETLGHDVSVELAPLNRLVETSRKAVREFAGLALPVIRAWCRKYNKSIPEIWQQPEPRYYASEHGVWGGKGAERLGLAGDISREDFVALASNKIPGTKEETLTVRTKDKRTGGYDFCFSVPKSVSICLAETGDKLVERMIHESFCETMADIESRMETRVRGRARTERRETTTGPLATWFMPPSSIR